MTCVGTEPLAVSREHDEVLRLSDREFGRVRTIEEIQIIQACEELYIAFCDLIDEGELEKAVSLHTEKTEIHQFGRSAPVVGHAAWLARLKQVRFSYPNRRVLHVPSNFRFHEVTPERAECRVVTALYDIVKNPEGRGISRYSTEPVGMAAEEAEFVPVDGVWKLNIRKVWFISGAKRLPVGTLPGDLNWEEDPR